MKPKEFLHQLEDGALDYKEIGRGMHLSYKNATSLIEDAETLREKKSGRSISLAILALEEIAKIYLLCAATAEAKEKKVQWKQIRKDLNLKSHIKKQNTFSIYGKAILDYMEEHGEFQGYEHKLPLGIAPLLDHMKQTGFYVDCFRGKFMSPDRFVSDNIDWVNWLIDMAKERLNRIRFMHNTEEASIAVSKMASMFGNVIENMPMDEFRKKMLEVLKTIKKDL